MRSPAKLQGVDEDQVFWEEEEQTRKKLQLAEEEEAAVVLRVPGRVQSGASCGLTCLLMASEYFGNHVAAAQLLEEARRRGVSAYGEMFDAEAVAGLAREALQMDGARVVWRWSDEEAQAHLTVARRPVMVPYDSDRDHRPALLGGAKSHWCLIIGVASADSWVVRQPKSRHASVWSRERLRSSNANLERCPPRDGYVIPVGLEGHLKDAAVFL